MIEQSREEIAGMLLGAYTSRQPVEPLTEKYDDRTGEIALIRAAVDEVAAARIAVLLLPGVGTAEDLRMAHDAGARWPGSRPTAPRPTSRSSTSARPVSSAWRRSGS